MAAASCEKCGKDGITVRTRPLTPEEAAGPGACLREEFPDVDLEMSERLETDGTVHYCEQLRVNVMLPGLGDFGLGCQITVKELLDDAFSSTWQMMLAQIKSEVASRITSQSNHSKRPN